MPGPALDCLADLLAADHTRDDLLHIGDVEPVPSRRRTVDVHIDIAPARQPLGECRTDARYAFRDCFDIMGDAVKLAEIGTGDLDPNRALDAGCEHVDAVADRWHPDIGEARHLHHPIELFDELVGGHLWPPMVARLEPDRRLEHFEGRRVGRGFGAAGLAEYAVDFGHGLEDRKSTRLNSSH